MIVAEKEVSGPITALLPRSLYLQQLALYSVYHGNVVQANARYRRSFISVRAPGICGFGFREERVFGRPSELVSWTRRASLAEAWATLQQSEIQACRHLQSQR